MIVFAGFFYQFLTSEKLVIFKQIKVTYRNSISNYVLMRNATKTKTVVIIFGVMYPKLYEYTLRTEAIVYPQLIT